MNAKELVSQIREAAGSIRVTTDLLAVRKAELARMEARLEVKQAIFVNDGMMTGSNDVQRKASLTAAFSVEIEEIAEAKADIALMTGSLEAARVTLRGLEDEIEVYKLEAALIPADEGPVDNIPF